MRDFENSSSKRQAMAYFVSKIGGENHGFAEHSPDKMVQSRVRNLESWLGSYVPS